MFEAKLAKCVVLKKILDAVKDLVVENNFEVSGSGMSLEAMDSSHVALVTINLNSGGFSKFYCDRNMVLGLNFGNLAKILKCAANDDKVTMRADDDQDDKIKLVFEAANGLKVSEYEIKLMNLDIEYLGIPDTDYSVRIKLPSAELMRICRDLSLVGDSVTIAVTSASEVQFSVTGDLGSGSIRLLKTSDIVMPEEAVQISMTEAITQSFSLKYLSQFAKASPICSQVTLALSPDVPLMVEYKVMDQEVNSQGYEFGHIRYYLAPRIDVIDE